MNFEPQKFFIGVIDLFSVLLPGALLTYMIKDYVGPAILGRANYCHLSGTEGVAVFVFASYLLGHFLFLLGSFLDFCLYGPLRDRTDKKQIKRLLYDDKLSLRPVRLLVTLLFGRHADAPLNKVLIIKKRYMRLVDAPNAINAFQWSKAKMAKENPQGLAIVNRFEADSKFFRSLIPVLVGALVISFVSCNGYLALASLILLPFALWRYIEQRFKSTQQAYWNILTMESNRISEKTASQPIDLSSAAAKPAVPTHAGGVVFRRRPAKYLGYLLAIVNFVTPRKSEKTIEYLLVTAKKDKTEWVLPKGHIELGEEATHCAIREVKEETGVWARILKRTEPGEKKQRAVELGTLDYTYNNEDVLCIYYLMEEVGSGKRGEDRERKWMSKKDALKKLRHDGLKKLLGEADDKLPSPIKPNQV